MKKLVLIMTLLLGINAIANGCYNFRSEENCGYAIENSSENCYYNAERNVNCNCNNQDIRFRVNR